MRRDYQARVAALAVLHACTCAKLLRAHGSDGHAANVERAIDEVTRILAGHFGNGALSAAMDWASDRLWKRNPEGAAPGNETLH